MTIERILPPAGLERGITISVGQCLTHCTQNRQNSSFGFSECNRVIFGLSECNRVSFGLSECSRVSFGLSSTQLGGGGGGGGLQPNQILLMKVCDNLQDPIR